MRWNLKELRDDVERLHGEEQQKLLFPCLESIVDRKCYARYHFQMSEQLLKKFLDEKIDDASLIKLVIGIDEEQQNDYYECRLHAKANIIACLQSMHAVADTLGHVVYYALNMNNEADMNIELNKISIHTVNDKLTKRPVYTTLYTLINRLKSDPEFVYLGDIVNHSKHRSIIGTNFVVNLQNNTERSRGLEFHGFEYKGRTHQNRWIDTYLEKEYKRQDNLTIEIGNEINSLVKSKLPK